MYISIIILTATLAVVSATTICTDGSGTHYEGSEWSYKCSRKRCLSGRTQVVESGCEMTNGVCLKHGEITTSGCTTYRCEVTGGYIVLNPVRQGCRLSDGRCLKHGETSVYGCTTYRCEIGHKNILLNPIQQGCKTSRGGCINVGSSITEGCARYQCLRNGNHLTLRSSAAGCQLARGKCIPLGQTHREGCNIYRCETYGNNQIGLNPSVRGCPTRDGRCIDLWKSWFEGCVEYRCTTQNEQLSQRTLRTMCTTAQNKCVALGSSNFPCIMRGIYRRNCWCLDNKDGTITYRATVDKRTFEETK